MKNLATLIAEMAVAARKGEPAAVDQIKLSLRKDPSRADPHMFSVDDNNLVEDALRPGPSVRKDVYPNIPKFVSSFDKRPFGVDASYVIAVVGKYPSLQKMFAAQGYKEIDRLEVSLVSNELLEPSGRAKAHKSIARLSSDGAPVWQNWIRESSRSDGLGIDSLVNRWLNQPVDWKESQYFDPVKRRRRFGLESAREFFEQLDFEHHYYLGLKLEDGVTESKEEKFKCVFLNDPIEDANARAAALGVKFRFAKRLR